MIKSDSIKAIAGALAKAQAEMDNASINSVNPHFKSRYADLPSVREAILGPLNANGISLTQIPSLNEHGGFELITLLMHGPSGEYIGGNYPLPLNGKPQEIGSAITYARRYASAAIAFVAADEDDDGNAAQGATAPVVRNPATGAKPAANDNKPAEWQAPAELKFDGNFVEWGTSLAERLKLAKSGDEVRAWLAMNANTMNTASNKAPRVHARLMTLGGESGKPATKADQEKTDAREHGTAKSAPDGTLEVFRLALDSAMTDAEIDKVCQNANLPKKEVDQAAKLAEARRKQIAVAA